MCPFHGPGAAWDVISKTFHWTHISVHVTLSCYYNIHILVSVLMIAMYLTKGKNSSVKTLFLITT